jgi:hypothetical protein
MFYYATSMKTPPKWIAASPKARQSAAIGSHLFFTGIR